MVHTARQWAGLFLLSALMPLLIGCANVLVPEVEPEDPVPVYLVDHGRHPSLVLPDGEGGGVRYTWGEWRWYGLNEAGLLRGVQALFWPTEPALGRQGFSHWRESHGLRSLIPEGLASVHEFEVAAERAEAFRERLDGEFHAVEEDAVYNKRYNLTFVPQEGRYWVPSHSNRVMIEWLRELGVEVSGLGIFSNWRVEAPDSAP